MADGETSCEACDGERWVDVEYAASRYALEPNTRREPCGECNALADDDEGPEADRDEERYRFAFDYEDGEGDARRSL